MNEPKSPQRSPVQQASAENTAAVQNAVVELRRRMGVSQQSLAVRMGKALVSISRWETMRPPSGPALAELENVATQEGHSDLARIFKQAAIFERNVMWIPLDEEEKDWHDVLVNILRNRRMPRVAAACETMFDEMLAVHKEVISGAKTAEAGKSDVRLFAVDLDEAVATQERVQKRRKEQKDGKTARPR